MAPEQLLIVWCLVSTLLQGSHHSLQLSKSLVQKGVPWTLNDVQRIPLLTESGDFWWAESDLLTSPRPHPPGGSWRRGPRRRRLWGSTPWPSPSPSGATSGSRWGPSCGTAAIHYIINIGNISIKLPTSPEVKYSCPYRMVKLNEEGEPQHGIIEIHHNLYWWVRGVIFCRLLHNWSMIY